MAYESINPFILNKIYPDATSILRSNFTSENGYKDYLFVLDTNTLLAPYSIGKDSMEKIKGIYLELINKKALYIPVHAISEFARVRSFKINEIYTNIDNALSTIPSLPKLDYPILYNIDSHKSFLEFKESFKEVTKKYKSLIQDLHDNVTNWNWQDPVTKIYSDIFKDEIFITSDYKEDELLKEAQFRFDNNIPPGFKDRGKPDNSLGDLLIWKSILALGKSKASNIVFVTNEEKIDWFVVGNKKPIVTRFELVNEYYRETNGKSFTCMSFSSFLELQGAESKVVGEVQNANERVFTFSSADEKPIEHNSLKELERIYRRIRIFLLRNHSEDDYYLDQELIYKIQIYRDVYRSEIAILRMPFNLILEIDEILQEISQLSSAIEYEHYRQKRDTSDKQERLYSLCISFLGLYKQISELTIKYS